MDRLLQEMVEPVMSMDRLKKRIEMHFDVDVSVRGRLDFLANVKVNSCGPPVDVERVKERLLMCAYERVVNARFDGVLPWGWRGLPPVGLMYEDGLRCLQRPRTTEMVELAHECFAYDFAPRVEVDRWFASSEQSDHLDRCMRRYGGWICLGEWARRVHECFPANAVVLTWCARYRPRTNDPRVPPALQLIRDALLVDEDYVPAYAVMLCLHTSVVQALSPATLRESDAVCLDACRRVLGCTDRMLLNANDHWTARQYMSVLYTRRNVGWTPGTHCDWMYMWEGPTTNRLFGAMMLGLNRLYETGVLVGRHDFVTEEIISEGGWTWRDSKYVQSRRPAKHD